MTIGDGIAKYEAELLANTLKSFFLTERGGKYASAFNLSDKSGWSPSKSEIVAKFASLRQSIAAFRANNPSAPTMVAIGLTGHGVSRDVFSEVKNGYSFSVKAGRSPSEPVQDFSGVELAEIISSLGADEVLVFVQSCNSGNLSNTDFMNKYARTLASESARQNTNIAVITPVSEYLLSPTKVIERVYKKAFDRLAKAQTDVVTYATFKDQFVRAVCEEEEFFYPRSEIKSATAVKAAADLYEIETLIGIDPQFYESIDPSLPLFLTNTGLLKYRNGSLKLSSRQPPVSNVPVSAETRQFCASQVAKRARIFARMESDRLLNLELAQPCYSSADKERCLNDVREMRNGYKPVAIEPALKEGEGIDEGIVTESPFPTPPPR